VVSALADPLWRKPLVTPYLRGDDGPEGENCTTMCNFQVLSYARDFSRSSFKL